VTDWAIRIPLRSKWDTLGDLVGNIRHLADEHDRAVALEVVAVAAMCGMRRAEHICMAYEAMTTSERHWALNRLRKRAGLPSTAEVEAHRRWQADDKAARLRMEESSPYQVCAEPTCMAFPIDSTTGLHAPVDCRRWWCEQHRHLATAGDLEPRPSILRLAPSGAFTEVDEAEANREAADNRRRQVEREQRTREREAADPTHEIPSKRRPTRWCRPDDHLAAIHPLDLLA
jgi:hypothetical protein